MKYNSLFDQIILKGIARKIYHHNEWKKMESNPFSALNPFAVNNYAATLNYDPCNSYTHSLISGSYNTTAKYPPTAIPSIKAQENSKERNQAIEDIFNPPAKREMDDFYSKLNFSLIKNQILDTAGVNSADINWRNIKTPQQNRRTKLRRLGNKRRISFVVMGSEGSSTLQNKYLGSTATAVVIGASVPVFVMPSAQVYTYPTKNILLALEDLGPNEIFSLEFPRTMAKKWNQKIDLLHISEDNSSKISFAENVSDFLEESMGSIFHNQNKDVGLEIKNFISQNNIDLLILKKRSKSLWSKIFSPNHITEEILRGLTSILILPK